VATRKLKPNQPAVGGVTTRPQSGFRRYPVTGREKTSKTLSPPVKKSQNPNSTKFLGQKTRGPGIMGKGGGGGGGGPKSKKDLNKKKNSKKEKRKEKKTPPPGCPPKKKPKTGKRPHKGGKNRKK